MGDIRLIGFFGDFGSYKSALCVAFARLMADATGLPIYTNFEIFHPNAHHLDLSDLLVVDSDDAIYCIDELMMSGFDSRSSMSGENKFGGYWIAQARKSPKHGLGNFVLYTSQLTSEADLRVFELTHMKFLLEKNADGNCDYKVLVGTSDYNEGTIPRSFFQRFSFGYYNTDEKIMPLGLENMRVALEMNNPQKINARVDAVCEEMLREFRWGGWKDVQRFTVEDYLTKKGYPSKLGRFVFNRLRELVRVSSFH